MPGASGRHNEHGQHLVSVDRMTQGLRTFLTFQGGAATAALEFYGDIFHDFELVAIENYGPGDIGPEGSVKVAKFRLAGSDFSCADSPVRHEWGFTPAVSLWIDCNDGIELQRLFDRLSDGGNVFMPLDNYGFSTRFGWVGDRYGVTWQLNVP
jgi:predicted 3-demethylubiquinone-9 3-methyltransferase (glyoxalase superfamily)